MSLGYGFAELVDAHDVAPVIKGLNGQQWLGKAIKVGKAVGATGSELPPDVAAAVAPTAILPASGVTPGDMTAAQAKAAAVAAAFAGAGSAAAATRAAGERNTKARLYVGSVPFEISADQLKEVFSAFGTVMSCTLLPPTDQTAGHQHRGYGFIEFGVRSALAFVDVDVCCVLSSQMVVCCWCCHEFFFARMKPWPRLQ